MTKNKSIFGTGTLLVGAGLLGAYLIYQKTNEAKEGMPQGSLGGTDELLGQQGFDIDPNSIPTQPDVYYVITPEGQIIPNETPTAGTDRGTGLPSNVPIASTGTGSLFQDASLVGGALGSNLMLPSIAKRINKLVDTKYLTDSVAKSSEQSAFKKFIKDPYAINDLAVSKAEKTGTREIAELAIDASGKTVLKTVPKSLKIVKQVANFIPLVDIPIGAGLDVYFSRYEEDPNKKIDWLSALKANAAGELAQLGIAGGAAAAGTVVPVAGNIAGGVTGFVVGTSADIAATELYYKQMGKTSLFSGSTSSSNESSGVATYNSITQVYTNASGQKQSMAASAPLAQAASQTSSSTSSSLSAFQAVASNPFTALPSSSSSGSSSSSSSSKSTSSNVTSSSSAPTSSSAKSSSVSTTSKVTSAAASAVSKVASTITSTSAKATSAAKSVASKVSSIFKGGKKK